jgi:multiple sugar transport system substrate-binding protein
VSKNRLPSRRSLLKLGAIAILATPLLQACGNPPPPPAAQKAATTGQNSAGAAPTTAKPTTTSQQAAPAAQAASSAPGSVRLSYWTVLGNVDGIVMNDMVKKFVNEHAGINVDSLQGVPDYIQKVEAAAISDTLPDVLLVRSSYVASFAEKNIIGAYEQADLDQVGIKEENYHKASWAFTHYKGKQYTIPLDIHLISTYYNKKAYSDAGLDPEKPAKTLDEWTTYGAKMKKSATDLGYTTFGLGNDEVITWYWWGIHSQFGGTMFDDAGAKATFNSPEGQQAVAWMADINKKAGTLQTSNISDLARTGKVASWPDGPWTLTLYYDKAKSPIMDSLGTATLPQHDPSKPKTWAQSHQFSLPIHKKGDADKHQAKLTFIKWVSDHSTDWSHAGQVPANNQARDEAFKSDDIVIQHLKTWFAEFDWATFMPHNPHLVEVMPRIGSAVNEVIIKGTPPAQALAKAEEAVNKILSGG